LNYEKRENRKMFELQKLLSPAPAARGGGVLREQNGFANRFAPLKSLCKKCNETYFTV
jgi:hypothetical protein